MARDETTMDPARLTSGAPVDEGLRCLDCDYNLTGLSGDVCPECGKTLDWPAVRKSRDERREAERLGVRPPAWEAWRWYLKPVAFVVTTAQIAFTPWIFARRHPIRPSVLWPVLFLLACVLGAYLLLEVTMKGLPAFYWLTAVLTHVVVQTGLLALVGVGSGVRHPLRFWFAVSCYTTWPVVVEAGAGATPPFIMPVFGGPFAGLHFGTNVWPFAAFETVGIGVPAELMSSFCFYVWVVGLLTIAGIRMPRTWVWRLVLVLLAVLGATLVSSYLGIQFILPDLLPVPP